MIYHTHNKQSGFSLVETLVAITILLIVIVGPMTLVVSSVRSTAYANDQVIASFLAQEGIEIVQAARDNLQLRQFSSSPAGATAWDSFTDNGGALDDCLTGGCGLYLDTTAAAPFSMVDCGTAVLEDNCILYYDDGAGERARYTHDDTIAGAEETKFKRIITISESPAGQAEVVSRVTWRSDGQRFEQEIETVTYLFDIYGI